MQPEALLRSPSAIERTGRVQRLRARRRVAALGALGRSSVADLGSRRTSNQYGECLLGRGKHQGSEDQRSRWMLRILAQPLSNIGYRDFAAIAAAIAFRAAKYSQDQARAAGDQVLEARAQSSAALQQSYVASFEFFSRRIYQLRSINLCATDLILAAKAGLSIQFEPEYRNEVEDFWQEYAIFLKAMKEKSSEFSWRSGSKINRFMSDANGVLIFLRDAMDTYDLYAEIGQTPPGVAVFRRKVRDAIMNEDAFREITDEIALAQLEIDKLAPLVFSATDTKTKL